MPSPTHQDFLLLFRNHPEVAFELARRAGVPLGHGHERLEVVDAEFDDPLRPGNTVRADVAIVGYIAGKPHQGLIFEVQLGDDGDKEWSTVLYRAGLRYRIKRPAWVVMFIPDAAVRAPLRRRFVHEPELRPMLVTPAMVPDIRNLDAALADYPWALLSATMHARGAGACIRALVAIQALLRLTPRDYERYIQLVAASVGREVMQQVREQLPRQDRERLSEFERRGGSFNLGLEEGLAQGREEGREEGLESLRTTLFGVLESRGLAIDDETRERISECTTFEQLREWIVRAATVSTTEGLLSP